MAINLTFAGAGSAFTTEPGRYQSNMVLQCSGSPSCLLIDCGSDARRSLGAIGVTVPCIDSVFISHAHADHCGGLEWLALSARYAVSGPVSGPVSGRFRPRLIMPGDVADCLWSGALSAGLRATSDGAADLETWFSPERVAADGVFMWSGITIRLVRTNHVGRGADGMPACGLLFRATAGEAEDAGSGQSGESGQSGQGGDTVYITGDTQFDPERLDWAYRAADIIFQDAETGPRTGVHAHYDDLVTLPQSFKEKMWLYHTPDGPQPDARRDGFRGVVATGQMFQFR